jgi:hypothetical protein
MCLSLSLSLFFFFPSYLLPKSVWVVFSTKRTSYSGDWAPFESRADMDFMISFSSKKDRKEQTGGVGMAS